MKKTSLFVLIVIFSMSASTALRGSDSKNLSENPAVKESTENKLSAEEINRLTMRVKEIRDIDKSTLSTEEKREMKKELKEIKKTARSNGSFIYIGGGTLLLILLLIILL